MAKSIEFTSLQDIADSVFADDPLSAHVFSGLVQSPLAEDEDSSSLMVLVQKDRILNRIDKAPVWDFQFSLHDDPDEQRTELRAKRWAAFAKGRKKARRRIEEGSEWVLIPC